MKIDVQKFLKKLSTNYPKDKGFQKNGVVLGGLLQNIIDDKSVTDIRWIAYILATVKHETADTYLPLEEYGEGKGRKYAKPGTNGKVFYGRGYVQLTWEENYKKFGKLLGVDLFNQPELACNADVACKIMNLGMVKGLFTGVGLDDYILNDKCDYYNARKIINALDKADLIAQYAFNFEKTLRDCHEPVI